jgi:hypothetical protein
MESHDGAEDERRERPGTADEDGHAPKSVHEFFLQAAFAFVINVTPGLRWRFSALTVWPGSVFSRILLHV